MNLSNGITVLRIVLTPFFLAAVYYSQWFVAIILFVSMTMSDILDGHIARKRNEVTKLGAFLDPLADKIFLILTIITLMIKFDLPIYYALILKRDILISLGILCIGLFSSKHKWNFTALSSGKFVTVLQIGIISLIFADQLWFALPEFLLPVLIGMAALAGLASSTHYLFKARVSSPR